MKRRRYLLQVLVITVCHCGGWLLAAEPRVELEVAVDQSFVGTEAGAWIEMLLQAGFSNVLIRSAGKDSPSLHMTGTEAAPAYRVIGVLTPENQLLLPAARRRFKLSDRAAIEAWLHKLREGGEESLTIKPAEFGLLPRQGAAVHAALAVPVSFSTVGKQPRDVAKQIAERLTIKFITDPGSQRALAADEPVLDELEGLSSGTALAAVLRPLGLVLVPEKTGSEVRLRIADGRTAKESWPVGSQPQGTPKETLPDLFKFLNVEIDKTPLSEALTAIASRLKAPLLIDYNALAKHEISLTTRVTLPKLNTFYAKALDRLLSQAKLHYVLRVDEANKPFLWITTIVP
jgi:hypothetical protein